MPDLICIFCEEPLFLNAAGDFECPKCQRAHYVIKVDGEETLATRPHRVRLKKLPEEGDKYDDVIQVIPKPRPN